MLWDMIQSPRATPESLSALRHLAYGGGPLNMELVGEIRRRMPQSVITNTYGQMMDVGPVALSVTVPTLSELIPLSLLLVAKITVPPVPRPPLPPATDDAAFDPVPPTPFECFAPITSRGDVTLIGRESDEGRSVAVTLPGELAHVELPAR